MTNINQHFSISIIVPVYNVEPYIADCLSSVMSQTMTEGVECIIVDDCGYDASIDIAYKMVNEYDGPISFSIIHHECNKGLSAARNTGIKAAKGDYLYFLDSDDKIIRECLGLLYSHVIKNKCVDLVQGVARDIDESEKCQLNFKCSYTQNKKEIKKYLLTFVGDIMSAQNRLIKKELLVSNHLFFKEGIIHEDCYWTFYLAKFVNSIAFCNEKTYLYTINPNSICNSINRVREIYSFRTIINDLTDDIDNFCSGIQKAFILNCLIIALNSKYYNNEREKKSLVSKYNKTNNFFEKFVFWVYMFVSNKNVKTKFFHLLLRIYNL